MMEFEVRQDQTEMNTKRQNVGIRRPSDEEQNLPNSNKRIKLLNIDYSKNNGADDSTHLDLGYTENCSVTVDEKPSNIAYESASILFESSLNGTNESDLHEKEHLICHQKSITQDSDNVSSSPGGKLQNCTKILDGTNTNNMSSPSKAIKLGIFMQSESLLQDVKPSIDEGHNESAVNNNDNCKLHSESVPIEPCQAPLSKSEIPEKEDVLFQPESQPLSSSSQEEISPQDVQCIEKTGHHTRRIASTKLQIEVENMMLSHLQVTELKGHADVVFCVASDEDLVLSSSGDTTVKVWSVNEGKEIKSLAGHSDAVTSVILLTQKESDNLKSKLSCSDTARIAVSGSLDCHIRVWSVLDSQEILSIYTFNGITCLGYFECQMYVVIGTEGGKLELWDICSAQLVHSLYAHESSISDIKVQGPYVYTASVDGAVKVWLIDENELQPLYTRRRKEISSDKSDFCPAQWKAIAVQNDIIYLGDNSSHLKVLDWRLGRLRLFVNHMNTNDPGICEAIFADENILLTSFYDSSSDTGGINVWSLPSMDYVCTLSGDVQDICSLSVTRTENILRIVSGGHQLLVWDFDFSKPPKKDSLESFYICENEMLGTEVREKAGETKKSDMGNNSLSQTDKSITEKKTWCNIS